MQWFHVIFKNFGRAVLRLLKPNDDWPLKFEVTTSKICNHFWKFGCQPQKGKTDLCMTNGSKVQSYLTYLSFCITKSLRNNKKDKQIRTLEPFVIQRSALPFWGWQPNFQKWLQIFKVITSKFRGQMSFGLNSLKMALPNILKIASNHCIFSKD